MNVGFVLQVFTNIAIPALLFGLAALGFAIIHRITRVLHLAHGSVMLVAGYVLFHLKEHAPWWSAIIGALLSSMLLGVLINEMIYEPLRRNKKQNSAGVLITTIALMVLIQNGILLASGSSTKSLSFTSSLKIYKDFSITSFEITLMVLVVVAAVITATVLKYTRLGTALRATADNAEAAEIVGIPVKMMRRIAFAIGSLLAGVAGVLFAFEYNLEPNLGMSFAIASFSRSLLGGVGSLGGAFAGSAVIETASNLGSLIISSAARDIISFLVVFLFLLVRPQGIFGDRSRV